MKYYISFLPFDKYDDLKLNKKLKRVILDIMDNEEEYYIGEYNNFFELILFLQDNEEYNYNKMSKLDTKYKGYTIILFSNKTKRKHIDNAYVLVYKE